jgi:hypothetical protein
MGKQENKKAEAIKKDRKRNLNASSWRKMVQAQKRSDQKVFTYAGFRKLINDMLEVAAKDRVDFEKTGNILVSSSSSSKKEKKSSKEKEEKKSSKEKKSEKGEGEETKKAKKKKKLYRTTEEFVELMRDHIAKHGGAIFREAREINAAAHPDQVAGNVNDRVKQGTQDWVRMQLDEVSAKKLSRSGRRAEVNPNHFVYREKKVHKLLERHVRAAIRNISHRDL